ncbi:Lissencephaly-1 [Marasmius crinis-equi]|uniref:Nuclear distribution protein PAC1 n=1 Tax=Marasmius crinis-equi TaxID=585013 RepID=A0ABR3FT66_9AGAR
MVSLTDRQQGELDLAIFHYLSARKSKFSRTLAAFQLESNIGQAPVNPRLEGILEKKWVAVLRLQKKVLELETRVKTLQEELDNASSPAQRGAVIADWIPKQGASPRHSLMGHRSPITSVAFHPVFSMLATASEDCTIKIWDWETGQFERTLTGHTRDVKCLDFHPKGTHLVSASSDLTLRLWETELWERRGYSGQTMHGHDHTISSARFLNSGDYIVSASRDRTIKVWEVATKFCIRTIAAHDDWVRSVTPSTDDRLLVSCSNDHMARVWEYKTGQMKAELRGGHDRQVEVAVFAPANTYSYIRELVGLEDNNDEPGVFAFTGGRDNLIIIWDAQSGRQLKTLIGHDGWIRGLEFHPSGKFLISVSDDKHMRVWDLATGRCTRVIQAHSHFVTCLAWGRTSHGVGQNGVNGAEANGAAVTKRANVIATGGVDLTVNIWTP